MRTNEVTSPASWARSLVEIDRLTKDYESVGANVQALKGISVRVSRGEFVAIMGSARSGKSSFLNILGCLEKPTSGTYALEGMDVMKSTSEERAYIRSRYVGFVSQGFDRISRMTALEYVGLPIFYSIVSNHLRNEKAKEALRKVGLPDSMYHLPHQLSRGQQQRVSIARALANDPSIVLVDEPTPQLDRRTSVEVMGILRELSDRGTTVFLVTQEPFIASFTTRQIVFREGLIVSDRDNHSPRTASEVLNDMPSIPMQGGIAA